MDEFTDKHLFNKIKEGDKNAFEYCYKQNFTGLYYYAKKFVGSSALAKDLVQECFLKIWENKKTISIESSFTAYLYKMVYNQVLNYIKHRQIVNKYQDYYKEKAYYLDIYSSITHETGQSIFIAKEFEKRINHAIENLPEKCNQIFRLSRFDGLKNREIAEQLNITINTVQKQISIALNKLREELTDIL